MDYLWQITSREVIERDLLVKSFLLETERRRTSKSVDALIDSNEKRIPFSKAL
jgi:hypothetical protein